MVWGKLLGGTFGFLVGGPIGAVLGAALGHRFDKGVQLQLSHEGMPGQEEALSPGDAERVRMSFFTATFSVLGHVAKADGRVDQAEIELAEAVMQRMSLSPELRKAAIALFNEGKADAFELEPMIVQFRNECARRTSLYRIFLEIQIQGALADGVMEDDEERVLREMGLLLGFGEASFHQIEMLVRFGMGMRGSGRGRGGGPGSGPGSGPSGTGSAGGSRRSGRRESAPPTRMSVADAYALLGVSRDDDRTTVKRAYRRLMSQHHPDKLVSKGLPEEMIRLATDKTQKIREAWDLIKGARKW